MNVLVACEESQAVCLAFRRLGHKAFSCDLQECSGGYPEYHFKGDMFDVIANIIRKTKCFDFWERNVLFPKTKRSFFRTPTLPFSA